MSKGKVWYVFDSEYPEEGVLAIVRARTAGVAEKKAQKMWPDYRPEVQAKFDPDDRVSMVAVRVSRLRRGWGPYRARVA